MLSTDPQDVRMLFLDILQNDNPKTRKSDTVLLFKQIRSQQLDFQPETSLPLVSACKLGDLKIIKLYLEHHAIAAQEEILDALKEAKEVYRKKDRNQSHKLQHLITLTEGIYKASMEFNAAYPTQVGFLESLHLAAFLGEKEDIGYCSKRAYRLPVSLIKQDKKVYVLYSREDRKSSICNQIGRGGYKEVYPALAISLKSREVIKAVQLVPKAHGRIFDKECMSLMKRFSDMGEGFPTLFLKTQYYSFKKGSKRDIAVQVLWEGGSLKNYTVSALMGNGKAPLTIEQQIGVASSVARGIKTMHQEKLVHGDIKPHNCLYDGDKKGCITDFDLMHESGRNLLHWGGKIYYGTTPYVAPEQLKQHYMEKGTGQPGDMYAFGLVLYEMFAGKPVWFDALIAHHERNSAPLNAIRRCYQNGKIDMGTFITAIEALFDSTNERQEIIALQQDCYNQLSSLQALVNPSLANRYHMLILKLLDPIPETRMTAKLFYKEINALKKEI